MKKLLPLTLILMAAAAPVLAAPPQPKIVVLDRAALLQISKAGQDVSKQLQALSNQSRASVDLEQERRRRRIGIGHRACNLGGRTRVAGESAAG